MDITAEHGGSDFSGVPEDTDPYFHPISGAFRYTTRGGDLMAVADDGSQSEKVGTADDDPYQKTLRPGNLRLLADDASVEFFTDFTGTGCYVVFKYPDGTNR